MIDGRRGGHRPDSKEASPVAASRTERANLLTRAPTVSVSLTRRVFTHSGYDATFADYAESGSKRLDAAPSPA